MVDRQKDYRESIMIRCITPAQLVRRGQVGYTHQHNHTVQKDTICKIHTQTNTHSLAAQEEKMQPQPSEHQHDDGDREAEDEPCAEVYHLRIWVATEETKRDTESYFIQC